jgi:glyoxylase-like metal-dependent hydrolase (beta-lactamase superfamily II)
MLHIHIFTFNVFQENTYIIWNDAREAIIIDPGCYSTSERKEVQNFLEEKQLKLTAVWCTHGHIDHIFGVEFLVNTYQVPFYAHRIAWQEMQSSLQYGGVYGTPISKIIPPTHYLEGGDTVTLGEISFKVLFTPGHSPGSISFYQAENQCVFAGDVLFQSGVGRWDLPGGNYDILLQSIVMQLLPLPESTIVYAGHGDTTTIGEEKRTNPYILSYT